MALVPRKYQGDHDQQRMMALVRIEPRDNFHIVDLPYRFSSWAFDTHDNICLWEDASGELLAWAVLQTPFWAIDYACHPAAPDTTHQQILGWADTQARQQLESPYGRPMWFVNVFDWQRQRQRDLEDHGFVSVADWGDDSWTKVLLHHAREHPLPIHPLPAGYAIRPLQGVQEI